MGDRQTWGKDWEPFGILPADRRLHMLLLGMSGTGKSTLMESMFLDDVLAGRGCALFDPHGDSIRNVLEKIPSYRIEDVVLFDPSDTEYPVSFNVFDGIPRERRHLVASGLVEAFRGIWRDSWGPRLEYILYGAIAAVLDCEGASLLSVQRMLSDAKHRGWVVRQVKDPIVKRFWTEEFDNYEKRFMAEAVAPIQNKIGQLLMSPVLRNILCQAKTRVSARHLIDRKKIFLVDLSKGKIGPDKSAILGALLVSQFYSAAMSRADLPRHARHDYTIYLDEFPSYVSTSLSSILAETRKFGLAAVLSTQQLGLEPSLVRAVLGNVGSIVSFRLGPEDALLMERAYGGNAKAEDFTALDNGHVLAKILRGGREGHPFLGRTRDRSPDICGHVETIIKRSRGRYARARGEVEAKIEKWSQPKQRQKKAARVQELRRPASYAKRRIAIRVREGPARRKPGNNTTGL